MNKKIRIFYLAFLLAFILSMGVSYASYYTVTIENDIDSNTIDATVGTVLIKKGDVVSEQFNVSDFSNKILREYDIFNWQGDSPIEISNTVGVIKTLQPGQSHSFIKGSFSYSNGTSTAQITVADIPELKGKLKINDTELDFVYDTSTIAITSTRLYEITLKDFEEKKGDFEYLVSFVTDDVTVSDDEQITIDLISLWNVSDTSFIDGTLKAGDYRSIGTIEIENQGNELFDVAISLSGDLGKFVNIPDKLTIYKGQKNILNVVVQIPNQESEKIVSGNITISNSAYTKSFPLNLSITDLTPPQIKSIDFAHSYMRKSNLVTLVAFDNIDVVSAMVNMSVNGNRLEFPMEKDNQIFKLNKSFASGLHIFSFCITDSSNNTVCQEVQKSFEPYNAVGVISAKEGNTVKINTWNTIDIFNVSEDPFGGLQLQLLGFSDSLGNVDLREYEARLLFEDDSVVDIKTINQTIVLKKGIVTLEVKGKNITSWEMKFGFGTDDFLLVPSDFLVKGHIGIYNTPVEYTSTFGEQQVTCKPFDNGVLEESFYECISRIPITTNVDDSLLVITIDEKALLDEKISELEAKRSKLIVQFIGSVVVLITMFILLLLAFGIYMFIMPRLVFLRGTKE